MVVIVRHGQVTVIAHPDQDAALVAALGPTGQPQRGGHVFPAPRLLRAVFRLLRRYGALPAVVAWTRTWHCAWLVDLAPSGGGVVGPFAVRAEALQAEEQWLLQQYWDSPGAGAGPVPAPAGGG